MSVTTLPVSDRFFSPEISVYKWLPAVANPTTGATRSEIDGGVALQDEIAALAGWETSTSFINTPDAGHRVVGRIPGRVTLGDASITFYADPKGDDIRKVLAKGDKGFMWFADGGDVPDSPSDLFQVEVANISKLRSVDEQAFQLTITFAIKRPPLEDVAIPAVAGG